MRMLPTFLLYLLAPLCLLAAPANAAFELEHDGGRLALFGRVQAGYGARLLQGDDDDQSKRRLRMRQVRLGVKANFFGGYAAKIAFDLRGDEGAPEATSLWLAWRPNAHLRWRIGQFKVPFSRHRVQKGRNLLFTDRPEAIDALVSGRDIGTQLTAATSDQRYALTVGAFNNRGANTTEEDEKGTPLLVARVEFMPLYPLAVGEGDVDDTQHLALMLGAAVAWSDDAEPALDGDDPNPLHSINGQKLAATVDLSLKFRGFFLAAELVTAQFKPDDGPEHYAAGYAVQTSYFVRRFKLEPALRLDILNPSDQVAGDRRGTLTGGLNYYPHREHDLKFMLDYAHALGDGDSPQWREHELSLVCQLAF